MYDKPKYLYRNSISNDVVVKDYESRSKSAKNLSIMPPQQTSNDKKELKKSHTMSAIKQRSKSRQGLFDFLDLKNLCIMMSCRNDQYDLTRAQSLSLRNDYYKMESKKDEEVKESNPLDKLALVGSISLLKTIEYTAEDLDEFKEKKSSSTSSSESLLTIGQEEEEKPKKMLPKSYSFIDYEMLRRPLGNVAIAKPEEISDDDFTFSSAKTTDNGDFSVIFRVFRVFILVYFCLFV